MVIEFIRLQAPAKPTPPENGQCQIIMLSVGDHQADAEMVELIKKCGGVRT